MADADSPACNYPCCLGVSKGSFPNCFRTELVATRSPIPMPRQISVPAALPAAKFMRARITEMMQPSRMNTMPAFSLAGNDEKIFWYEDMSDISPFRQKRE